MHTVYNKPTTAPALNILSLKDPSYDSPTSFDDNTYLFLIDSSDKD